MLNLFVGLPTVLAQASDADAGEKSTVLDMIRAGGPVGMVIIGLSFVAVLFILIHVFQARKSKLAPVDVVERLGELLAARDVQGAIAYAQASENDSYVARVIAQALTRCSRSPFGLLELRTAVEEAGYEQSARLHRSTDIIDLIARVAPMLGLLGTVVGMVGAFDVISTSEGMAKPSELAGDISQALITTVMGLIVAIPCTALHNYFSNRIENLTADATEIVEQLAARLDRPQGRTAQRPTTPPAPGAPRSAAPPAPPASAVPPPTPRPPMPTGGGGAK